MAIYGNTVGGFAPVKVVQLELEDGTVLEGVVAEEAPVVDATENDVRKGKKAITSMGVIEGQKDIPAYRTTAGTRKIKPGDSFSIPLSGYDKYDYTKLQCIIVQYNTSLSDSVVADKVVINDYLYPVLSTEKISTITKNFTDKSIDFNIINDSENTYVIRYFTYREEE